MQLDLRIGPEVARHGESLEAAAGCRLNLRAR
jgi:hypothetical protein